MAKVKRTSKPPGMDLQDGMMQWLQSQKAQPDVNVEARIAWERFDFRDILKRSNWVKDQGK